MLCILSTHADLTFLHDRVHLLYAAYLCVAVSLVACLGIDW